jgi:hypothetical protein
VATDTVTKCLGLVTQHNPLEIQKGGLVKADNAVVRRPNVIENRRGYAQYGALANTPKQFLKYAGRVLVHHGSVLSYDNGSGTFADYTGTYSAPSGYLMRGVEANSNLYITTSAGVKVITDIAGTQARQAGVPRSLDPSYEMAGAASGFLDASYQCAYRAVIKRIDANGNVLLGYPSTRIVAYNTGATSDNVELTLYLPTEVTTADTIQFYRTAKVSGVASDASGDEMGLVYEVKPTSSDITNGFLTFTDSITDELRGATLYTSPSQEGIQQGNSRPPLAKCLALYKSAFMIYANTATKQRLFFSLIGATRLGFATTGDTTNGSDQLVNVADTTNLAIGWKVSGTGIPAGTTVANIVGSTVTLSQNATVTDTGVDITFTTDETLTLAGTAYGFGTTEIVSGAGSPQVKVSVTGTPAVDIDETARSLVRVINRYASNTSVYAYYLSGSDDIPGSLLIEERTLGGAAFTLQVSAAAMAGDFSPSPPVAPATSSESTSSNDVRKNGLFYSKSQQLEHVPELNYLPVGPSNTEILGAVALRDSLIILKEEGVYRMTGETAQSFSVTTLDDTVRCKARNSICKLANKVYMFSDQGIVEVSDTGVQVKSWDIEKSIQKLLPLSNLDDYTYGIAYESDRTLLMSTVATGADAEPTQTWVYNVFTSAWTRYPFGITAGIVEDGADKLYFALPDQLNVYRERKDYTASDYADPDHEIEITAIDGDEVTFTLTGATPEEGWVIEQDGAEGPPITDIVDNGSNSYTATLSEDAPAAWDAGAADIFPPVELDVEWNAWNSLPGTLKQAQEFKILADSIEETSQTTEVVATFRTDLDGDREEVPLDTASSSWGSSWGGFPWGGISDQDAYPTWPPRNKAYFRLMNPGVIHRRAREPFACDGYALTFEVISERTSK